MIIQSLQSNGTLITGFHMIPRIGAYCFPRWQKINLTTHPVVSGILIVLSIPINLKFNKNRLSSLYEASAAETTLLARNHWLCLRPWKLVSMFRIQDGVFTSKIEVVVTCRRRQSCVQFFSRGDIVYTIGIQSTVSQNRRLRSFNWRAKRAALCTINGIEASFLSLANSISIRLDEWLCTARQLVLRCNMHFASFFLSWEEI